MPGTFSALVWMEHPCSYYAGHLIVGKLESCQERLPGGCRGRFCFFLVLGSLQTLFLEVEIRSRLISQLMSFRSLM